MKKLALILAALATVSAVASAKEVVAAPVAAVEPVTCPEPAVIEKVITPDFRVTSVELRFANNDVSGEGSNFGDGNWWQMTTNLAYGDNWTGHIRGRRMFNSDDSEGLYKKTATRYQVMASRNNIVTDFGTFALGGTLRSQNNYDFYLGDLGFKFGKYVSGYLDYGYFNREDSKSYNVTYPGEVAEGYTSSNAHYVEFQPKVSYAGWGVSYYFEGEYAVGNNYEFTYQQLRLFTPTWKITDKLTAAVEYRWYLTLKEEDNNGNTISELEDFASHRPIAKLNYQINDTYRLFFDFGYDMRDYKTRYSTAATGTTAKKNDVRQSIIETGISIKF